MKKVIAVRKPQKKAGEKERMAEEEMNKAMDKLEASAEEGNLIYNDQKISDFLLLQLKHQKMLLQMQLNPKKKLLQIRLWLQEDRK
jgi:hypothetical protein